MSFRRNGSDRRDDLDRLIAHTLHAAVRGVEPPPRIWQNICTTIAAEQARWDARPAPLRALLRLISGWLVPVRSHYGCGIEFHDSLIRDVVGAPYSFVWWPGSGLAPCGVHPGRLALIS